MTSDWVKAIPAPLWSFPRIVRKERRSLGTYSLDASELERCATERQGLVIDRCPLQTAAKLIELFALRLQHGLMWVLVPSTFERSAIVRPGTENEEETDAPEVDFAVHQDHPLYPQMPQTWIKANRRTLVVTYYGLERTGPLNPLSRATILEIFCPLLVLVDPAMEVLESTPVHRPARAVQQVLGKLGARQSATAVVVITAKDVKTFFPSAIEKSLLLEGLIFLDGTPPRPTRGREGV